MTFLIIIAFVSLLAGNVAIYLGEMHESFYSDKTRLGIIADICYFVAFVWVVFPFLTSSTMTGIFLSLIIAVIFGWFSWRFYVKSASL